MYLARCIPTANKTRLPLGGERETNSICPREVSWEAVCNCQADTICLLPDPALLSGLTLGDVENIVKISISKISIPPRFHPALDTNKLCDLEQVTCLS